MSTRHYAAITLGISAAMAALLIGSCGSQGEPEDTLSLDASAGPEAAAEGGLPDGSFEDAFDARADEASDADSGSSYCQGDAGPEWVFDPELWKTVPAASFTQPVCTVTEALADKLPLPALQWEPCGPGCEFTDPSDGLTTAERPAFFVAGDSEHQETYVTLEHFVPCGGRFVTVLRTVRLSDGKTIAAIKSDEKSPAPLPLTCAFEFSGNVNVLYAGDGWCHARVPFDGGPLVWASPPSWRSEEAPGQQIFDIDYNGGALLTVGGHVFIADDPTSNSWRALESPSGSRRGAGEGDLAVWTDIAEPGFARIRGWAPDGEGVRDIITGLTDTTIQLALSWDRIVGFAGDYDSLGFFTRLRLWTSPRAYETTADVSYGPDLLADRHAVLTPVTAGAFAAANCRPKSDPGGPLNPSWILVVDLETFDAWRLDSQSDRYWTNPGQVLTRTHLYAADNLGGGMEARVARRIYRYDLSQIELWATRLE